MKYCWSNTVLSYHPRLWRLLQSLQQQLITRYRTLNHFSLDTKHQQCIIRLLVDTNFCSMRCSLYNDASKMTIRTIKIRLHNVVQLSLPMKINATTSIIKKLVILMKNKPIMDEPTPETRSILRMTLAWPGMCVDVWSSLCPLRIHQLSCWPLAWWSPRVFTLRRSCWPKGPWIERQTTLGKDSTTNFERLVVLDSAGNDRLCCDLAASVHLNDFMQFVDHDAESAS